MQQLQATMANKMLEIGVGSYSRGQHEHHNFGQQSDALPRARWCQMNPQLMALKYTPIGGIFRPLMDAKCNTKQQQKTGQNNEKKKQQTNYAKGIGQLSLKQEIDGSKLSKIW